MTCSSPSAIAPTISQAGFTPKTLIPTRQAAAISQPTAPFTAFFLHTIGAANPIDRIIDVFPANQQRQIAVQLSLGLNNFITTQGFSTTPATDEIAAAMQTMMISDGRIDPASADNAPRYPPSRQPI
mgnify:CR=1 FL=1